MRKNHMKKITIAMMSCCALACFSVAAVTAGAEETKSVAIANTNSFYVVNGASVLLNTSSVGGVDNNGMRFVFEMSTTQYESLLVDPQAETKAFREDVSVGALVVPTAQIGVNETGETVTTDDVVNCKATARQEIPFAKWKYADSEMDGKEEKVYYACAYLYNLPPVAYDAEISACAYITTSEGTVYTNVSTRTMSFVADAALDSGKYTDSETVLKGYIPTLEEKLYSIDDATLDLSDLKGTVTEIKNKDGESIMSAQTNNVATIAGDSVLNGVATEATGATETVTVSTTVATYNLPLKVYTDVIDSAAEFDEMKKFLVDTTTAAKANTTDSGYCKIIRGYYILGADLDFAKEYPNGYASPFGQYDIGDQTSGYTHGWEATFDGNGHTISGLKLIKSGSTWRNSLFGIIKGDAAETADDTFGVIKDVAFVNCSMNDSSSARLYGSAFLANRVFGKVENVYLDVTLNTSHTNASGNSILVGYDQAGLDKNGTFNNVTVVVGGLGANHDYVMKGADSTITAIKGSVVIIGAAENKIHNKIATIEALTTANENIKAYTSVENASGDSALTGCGTTAFANNNGVYTITWNGKTVYSKEIVFELAQTLYSIDDATIDFAKLGVTVNEDTVITRNGANVAFTLDGQVATISGDSVLNGVATEATGAVTTIVVSTGSAKYNLPLKVCSDVIDTAVEFDDMKKFLADTETVATANTTTSGYCKIIEGYYILGADLDFAKEYPNGYASPFGYYDVGDKSGAYTHGWSATFDGNGHTISGLKIVKAGSTWRNSLFGVVKAANTTLGTAAGVIKDVAFVDCSVDNLYGSAFLANVIAGTVENVYLDVTLNTTHTNAAGVSVLVRRNAADQSIYNMASISNVTIVAAGLGANDYVVADNMTTLTTIKGSFVVIGVAENKIHNKYTTIEALTAANSNIKAYTSAAGASALTACGNNITFATTDNVFTIAWKGKTVYSENLQ